MRKLAFCICKNKDADQLRGNRKADQCLCFCYTDSTIPLLPKSGISSLQPSCVAVQPGLYGTRSKTPKSGFLTTRLNYASRYLAFGSNSRLQTISNNSGPLVFDFTGISLGINLLADTFSLWLKKQIANHNYLLKVDLWSLISLADLWKQIFIFGVKWFEYSAIDFTGI